MGAAAGWEAVNPVTQHHIRATSLLSSSNLERLLVEMPRTLTGFAPLGYVLLVMLGAGIAERTGLRPRGARGGAVAAPGTHHPLDQADDAQMRGRIAIVGDPIVQAKSPLLYNPRIARAGRNAVLVPWHAPEAHVDAVMAGQTPPSADLIALTQFKKAEYSVVRGIAFGNSFWMRPMKCLTWALLKTSKPFSSQRRKNAKRFCSRQLCHRELTPSPAVTNVNRFESPSNAHQPRRELCPW